LRIDAKKIPRLLTLRKNSSFTQGGQVKLRFVMAMTFTLGENFANFEPAGFEGINSTAMPQTGVKDDKIQLFAEKLSVPATEGYIQRPRLDRLLERSLEQVGAVLITGRAGTGKTDLTANFVKRYQDRVWYRVEAADSDWKIFSSYLSQGINGRPAANAGQSVGVFVEKLLERPAHPEKEPRLIVLDDVHHVFDTEWFYEFFSTALQSLSPKTHLILLSRSKPALPLWRLRSKQALIVVDEKGMAFDLMEASIFCKRAGVSPEESAKFYAESFGRIGKLKALTEAE
jgi:LuxR family maltose regulon positive regulatory protein